MLRCQFDKNALLFCNGILFIPFLSIFPTFYFFLQIKLADAQEIKDRDIKKEMERLERVSIFYLIIINDIFTNFNEILKPIKVSLKFSKELHLCTKKDKRDGSLDSTGMSG